MFVCLTTTVWRYVYTLGAQIKNAGGLKQVLKTWVRVLFVAKGIQIYTR